MLLEGLVQLARSLPVLRAASSSTEHSFLNDFTKAKVKAKIKAKVKAKVKAKAKVKVKNSGGGGACPPPEFLTLTLALA